MQYVSNGVPEDHPNVPVPKCLEGRARRISRLELSACRLNLKVEDIVRVVFTVADAITQPYSRHCCEDCPLTCRCKSEDDACK